MSADLSLRRIGAVLVKEFIQMWRDRLTSGLILGVPLMQLLLFGFACPVRGLPVWAQWIGDVLPVIHFLRVVRSIMLKANGPAEIWPSVWPLFVFLFAAGTAALLRLRRTLD